MAEEITHKGRILDVNPSFTTVEIISESACSACHAKGLCSLSEQKTKEIRVPTRGWDSFSPGDEVTIGMKATMGHKAVWLAYAIPLAALVAVLMLHTAAGLSELISGLAGLSSIAVYYLGIWLLRDKLRNEFSFNIKV